VVQSVWEAGDLAPVDAQGYIYIKGRKSFMIRSGGENISPEAVEAVIMRHPAVSDVAVLGVPDEFCGARLLERWWC